MSIQDLRSRYPWITEKPSVAPNEIPRYYSDTTTQLVKNLVKSENDIIIELGSWLGTGTKSFCSLVPHGHVIPVDVWTYDFNPNPVVVNLYPVAYETFLVNCWDLQHQITPLRMSTHTGLGLISFYGIEPSVVYIDASHEPHMVLADIEISMKLFPEARIIGDDVSWWGVMDSVVQVQKKYNKKLYCIENTWWFE